MLFSFKNWAWTLRRGRLNDWLQPKQAGQIMKINYNPVVLAPYIKEVPEPAQKSGEIAATDVKNLPPSGPLYRIPVSSANAPYAPPATSVDKEQVAETVLRFLSSRVAEHFGQHAIIAKNVVWLCFDLKKLHDNLHKPDPDNTKNFVQATNLVGDLLSTASLLPKLDCAADAATAFYFVAEVGDKAYKGSGTFTSDDVMKFVPLKPEDNAWQEFKSTVDDFLDQLEPT